MSLHPVISAKRMTLLQAQDHEVESIVGETADRDSLKTASRTQLVEHYTLIEAPRAWRGLDLRELWSYRDLLIILALRDIKARYRQTRLGIAWAVFQPLSLMLVFTVFFSLLGTKPTSTGIPYALSLFCALLPWQFFASVLLQSSDSLAANQALLSKVYCPRLIFPLVPAIAASVDFAIGFVVLMGMFLYFGTLPVWTVIALPALLLLAAATALGIGLWVSALSVRHRDLRFTMPVLVQVWFYVSPVIYDANTLIPPQWIWLYSLNPMVGVIEGFRWAMLGSRGAPVEAITISLASVAALLVSGLYFFRSVEQTVADSL